MFVEISVVKQKKNMPDVAKCVTKAFPGCGHKYMFGVPHPFAVPPGQMMGKVVK
jgi:hypothetical protein